MSPTNFTDYMREYQRERRAELKAHGLRGDGKIPHSLRESMRPFVGIDGEGGNLPNGYHAYFMLRAGDRLLVPRPGNVRLSTYDCLTFLTSLPTNPIYVGYFFDYDTTKILEDLGWDKLDRLIHREGRRRSTSGYYPVSWSDFDVDYLPGKELKVRRNSRDVSGSWVTVSDVGSFFQVRFTEALAAWSIGDPDQRRIVEEGKELRGSFSLSDMDMLDEYNTTECKLLAELMETFRDACESVGYVPRRWQGPGQLAEAFFERHNVPPSKKVPLLQTNAELMAFAQDSFYGGRPEVSAVGPIPGPVFQWDLNSAYPYAMLSLPCLLHGEWEYVEHSEPVFVNYPSTLPTGVLGETYSIDFGSFYGDPGHSFYGLPVRAKDGGISYPRNGRGWYHSFEIGNSVHQSFASEKSWTYTRTCNCHPLNFVHEVYTQRQAIGKDGPGVVLKLGLNSMYGKCVQSVGTPKYSNPVWGSFITAYCRSMVQTFIHSSADCLAGRPCGQDVFMIATDSVCTTTDRTDIESTKELGGWSQEVHPDGIFIIQPGLYFTSSGKPTRTRGVPRRAVEDLEEVFAESFDRMVRSHDISDGNVRVPQTIFVGIKYALHRRDMRLLGQWIQFTDAETGETGKVISFDWRAKRKDKVRDPTEHRTYILTDAPDGDRTQCTVPYDKSIGGLVQREELRLQEADQPDWAQLPLPEMTHGQ